MPSARSPVPEWPIRLADPATLARSVALGIMDAPQLRSNQFARGQVITRIDGRGACIAIDALGHPIEERERTSALLR